MRDWTEIWETSDKNNLVPKLTQRKRKESEATDLRAKVSPQTPLDLVVVRGKGLCVSKCTNANEIKIWETTGIKTADPSECNERARDLRARFCFKRIGPRLCQTGEGMRARARVR